MAQHEPVRHGTGLQDMALQDTAWQSTSVRLGTSWHVVTEAVPRARRRSAQLPRHAPRAAVAAVKPVGPIGSKGVCLQTAVGRRGEEVASRRGDALARSAL
eukprot:364905-Chlamydomonas_euryale.AAC.28